MSTIQFSPTSFYLTKRNWTPVHLICDSSTSDFEYPVWGFDFPTPISGSNIQSTSENNIPISYPWEVAEFGIRWLGCFWGPR